MDIVVQKDKEIDQLNKSLHEQAAVIKNLENKLSENQKSIPLENEISENQKQTTWIIKSLKTKKLSNQQRK